MKYFLLIFLMSLSFPSLSNTFCKRDNAHIRELLEDSESRISFKNRGGLINGGVCWWHSRMQRSSIYLAQFAPARNKPTSQEALNILWKLRNMNEVVVIPGYDNFFNFSTDYEKEMQSVLEAWQRFDGFYNFQWLRGISGKHSLPPEIMEKRMEVVFNAYKSSPAPLWIMAQIKGITSHSFLINRMQKIESGYVMDLIDSNKPKVITEVRYQFGDMVLREPNAKYSFVPYVGFQEDFRLIGKSLGQHCRNKSSLGHLLNVTPGDVEISHRR